MIPSPSFHSFMFIHSLMVFQQILSLCHRYAWPWETAMIWQRRFLSSQTWYSKENNLKQTSKKKNQNKTEALTKLFQSQLCDLICWKTPEYVVERTVFQGHCKGRGDSGGGLKALGSVNENPHPGLFVTLKVKFRNVEYYLHVEMWLLEFLDEAETSLREARL